MAEWADAKVRPGGKVYLFLGPGNAQDDLLARARPEHSQTHRLRPPLRPDDLAVSYHTVGEPLILWVRDVETATTADWDLIEAYLSTPKIPGRSLILTGTATIAEAKNARSKISRQGTLVEARNPTGQVGRKHLIHWLANTWQTTDAAATLACQRADYRIDTLLWATRIHHALTSGRPTEGSLALALARLSVPTEATDTVYRLVLAQDRRAVQAARQLHPREHLGLFRRLESALTDLELLHPVLRSGSSVKAAADKTGIHIARALDLAEWASRYSPDVVIRCRRVLALGLDHPEEAEAATTVAVLWS